MPRPPLGPLEEAVVQQLLACADHQATAFRGEAAQVVVARTTRGRAAALSGSGSATDSTPVWVLSVEAGDAPFLHVRLGPDHPVRGILLVLRQDDLALLDRGASAAPFDISRWGPTAVLRPRTGP